MKKQILTKRNIGPIILFSLLGGGTEEEQAKAAALKVVKDTATEAAKAAFDAQSVELIKEGLGSEKAKELMKGIAETALSGLKVKQGEKDTLLVDVLKSLQTQHDALSTKVNGGTGGEATKSFAEQLGEQLKAKATDLSAIHENKSGVVSLDIKAVAPIGLGNFGAGVIPGFREGGIDRPGLPERFIFGLISTMNGGVGSNPLTWIEMVPKEGTPAWTAENALKPGMDWTYKENKATAEMIAVWVAITRQALLNTAMIEQEVNFELSRKLFHALDKAVINGDGTNDQPFGIKYYATSFVAGSLAGTIVNANHSDVIRAAVGQVRKGAAVANADLGGFNPNYALVSVDTATAMDLEKNANGTYTIPPYINAEGTRVKGVTVIESNFLADDEFIVGDFSRYLFNIVDGLRIDIGYVNDQFIKNQLTVRAELYGMGRVKFNERPAFVKGGFTAAIAALNKEEIPAG